MLRSFVLPDFPWQARFGCLGRWLKHEQLLNAEQLRRRWLALIACILLYFSGPLVFFNLYYIHDYYWCANTVFLVAAMGLCVATMIEMGKASRVAGTAILLLVIAGSLQTYSGYYYRDQIGQFEAIPVMYGKAYNDSVLAISRKIEENTRPEELLVSFHDWNTDLAYYSKRRSNQSAIFSSGELGTADRRHGENSRRDLWSIGNRSDRRREVCSGKNLENHGTEWIRNALHRHRRQIGIVFAQKNPPQRH